jgi:hypothetical protein
LSGGAGSNFLAMLSLREKFNASANPVFPQTGPNCP